MKSVVLSHKLKNLLNYTILVILTALMVVSALIALPMTEDYFPQFNYDLNLKENDYEAKSYILELSIKPEDEADASSKIRATENILHERLDRYEVEVVKITDYEMPEEEPEEEVDEAEDSKKEAEEGVIDEELKSILDQEGIDYLDEPGPDLDELNDEGLKHHIRINVETTRDMEKVDQLIRSRNYLRLMTPKDDVDFDDPENVIAQYLRENYEDTEYTRRSFRSVVIKELPTSSGDTAYFSIYKPKTLERDQFNDFLDEYAGQRIGIRTDEFVVPFNVPIEFSKDYQKSQNSSTQPEFAPSIANTVEDAEVMDVLLNSGVIPTSYQVLEEEDVEVTIVKPDYYTSIAAVAAAILAIVVFIGWRNVRNRRENAVFVLSVIFTFALWISLLKLLQVPVDLDIMFFVGFLLIFFIKLINFRKTTRYVIEMMTLLTLLFAYLLGEGYLQIFSRQMFLVALLAIMITALMRYYTDNIKRYVLK